MITSVRTEAEATHSDHTIGKEQSNMLHTFIYDTSCFSDWLVNSKSAARDPGAVPREK